MGHTRYKKVILGHNGNIRYTQTNRKAHMYIRVATVAITGLPMPRKDAPIISFMPQIKYVLEMIIIFCLE